MYARDWRTRLREELKRTGTSLVAASQAAEMHDGWVSEALNPKKNKEPTIAPFARMCIRKGLRLSYIMTGEGRNAEDEQFAALFSLLDEKTKRMLVAGLQEAVRNLEVAQPIEDADAKAARGRLAKPVE